MTTRPRDNQRSRCYEWEPAAVQSDSIFVFGSNLAGRHGKGAAVHALRNCGARYGCGEGHQGGSYAIPTKDAALRTLPLSNIKVYVDRFLVFAATHPELRFEVTPIGCGLAGYKPVDIAPLFCGAPENCALPREFLAVLRAEAPPAPFFRVPHQPRVVSSSERADQTFPLPNIQGRRVDDAAD